MTELQVLLVTSVSQKILRAFNEKTLQILIGIACAMTQLSYLFEYPLQYDDRQNNTIIFILRLQLKSLFHLEIKTILPEQYYYCHDASQLQLDPLLTTGHSCLVATSDRSCYNPKPLTASLSLDSQQVVGAAGYQPSQAHHHYPQQPDPVSAQQYHVPQQTIPQPTPPPLSQSIASKVGRILQNLAQSGDDQYLRYPQLQHFTSAFHSTVVPSVPIQAYFVYVSVNAGLVDHQSVIALVLIERLCNCAANQHGLPIAINSLTIHRLILTAVLLTSKFYNDVFYGNNFIAAMGGVSLQELNFLEAEFLALIDWRLWVEPSTEFEIYFRGVLAHFAQPTLIPQQVIAPAYPQQQIMSPQQTVMPQPQYVATPPPQQQQAYYQQEPAEYAQNQHPSIKSANPLSVSATSCSSTVESLSGASHHEPSNSSFEEQRHALIAQKDQIISPPEYSSKPPSNSGGSYYSQSQMPEYSNRQSHLQYPLQTSQGVNFSQGFSSPLY
ncbi:hypothetical protein FGO68_gene3855 [Halteria grandinella]|uniref:Cyclin n=1 Tax=Halteria grandinella TaxID=5974 RepID=A0A8J8T9L4_HALGN|nr:hypothetical protein FGO68_gene3855 [Halteria grandinella]